ncbi:MAG: CrcB family protein [Deltaproteobacteria bacterium]|nr:CrcB family protein [Deltaproteobacteria bacterium]MBI3296508.1 CrcB family protein [Deltaproteobacteria bacterium]
MLRFWYIGIFGLFGVYARYIIGLVVAKFFAAPPFPYATFGINILGAFLVGLVYVLGVERAAIPTEVRVGLMVGFLGGFTTFSSYCLEISRLIEEGQPFLAGLYFCLSSLLGVLGVFAGFFFGRNVFSGGAL